MGKTHLFNNFHLILLFQFISFLHLTLFLPILPLLLITPATTAYLAMPSDSCKVSLTFCIEANALANPKTLDKTRELLKNIYSFTVTNFNFHFVPSAALVYSRNSSTSSQLTTFEFQQLFEYRSFFLSEDFSAALKRVPRKAKNEKLQPEDAQRGAEECLHIAATAAPPYEANNMVVVVSQNNVNRTQLNDLGLSGEWVVGVALIESFSGVESLLGVESLFAKVCNGRAVDTCGTPEMFFGVQLGSCSGYREGSTCVVVCPAPYSEEKRVIRCVIGTGWVINERCRG